MRLEKTAACDAHSIPTPGVSNDHWNANSSSWQFSDKGIHVEVKKGTGLCSSIAVDGVRGTLNQRPIFWSVTSPMHANGTQTVSALVHETVCNRNSGDTTTVENAYDEHFATFFQRASEHKGMLEMISPQDGSLQAIVEICGIGK
jgi:hypothetical protein